MKLLSNGSEQRKGNAPAKLSAIGIINVFVFPKTAKAVKDSNAFDLQTPPKRSLTPIRRLTARVNAEFKAADSKPTNKFNKGNPTK